MSISIPHQTVFPPPTKRKFKGSASRLRAMEPGDRAFLPAALEILETPPSPVPMAMLLTICLLVAAGFTWSWFGRLDIVATARGKFEPVGQVKVVQPLQPGRVAHLLVTEGQTVKTGQVLISLDAREAEADLMQTTVAMAAAQADAIRRHAEIQIVETGLRRLPADIKWPDAIPDSLREREAGVLTSDLAELSTTLAHLDDQEGEKLAAVAQLDFILEADRALVRPLADRVALRRTLQQEGNGSRLNLLDAVQAVLENEVQIAGDVGRRAVAQAALASLRSDRQRTVESFLADDRRKLADADRVADEKALERLKAIARLDQLTLKAPTDGVVQALAVTGPGQVVTTGQEVLRIVPTSGPLQFMAYIRNDDIGFVRTGQAASLKLDSFPFTKFGLLDADVTEIAFDAIPDVDANEELGDGTQKGQPLERQMTPTGRQMTNLVFPIRIIPRTAAIEVDGRAIPLTSGMTAAVEIRTGSRRIIDYVLSPLIKTVSTSFRER